MGQILLNAKQTAEKLGVSGVTLRKFVEGGRIMDRAERKEGASKHFGKFDLTDVRRLGAELAAERKERGLSPRPKLPATAAPTAPTGVGGIFTRLDSIDGKLDQLIALLG